MQQRADRSVPALVHGFADLAHAQVESRVHGVHQRGFADSGWACQHGCLPRENVVELFKSDALLYTGQVQRVSSRDVVRKRALGLLFVDELDLVDDDPRLELIPFRNH